MSFAMWGRGSTGCFSRCMLMLPGSSRIVRLQAETWVAENMSLAKYLSSGIRYARAAAAVCVRLSSGGIRNSRPNVTECINTPEKLSLAEFAASLLHSNNIRLSTILLLKVLGSEEICCTEKK